MTRLEFRLVSSLTGRFGPVMKKLILTISESGCHFTGDQVIEDQIFTYFEALCYLVALYLTHVVFIL